LAAGKVGILYNPSHGGSYPLQSVRDNDPKADWQAYPILSIDGEPAKVQAQSKPLGYWVVKKGYEHPEAIIKMMDFWIKTFYENKDLAIKEKYVATVDGNTPWLLNAIAAYRSFFNVEIQNEIADVINGKKKKEDLAPIALDTYTKVTDFTERGDEKFWGFDKVYGLNGARGITSSVYIKNNLFMENEFYTSATPTMATKMSTLQKMRDETFTKIITGNSPIEEFDKFVENWKKGGGEEITKEVNEWAGSR
jgi:putative aldouronate transport system substrate-binding protein